MHIRFAVSRPWAILSFFLCVCILCFVYYVQYIESTLEPRASL
jgi:hypothetical protein